MIYSGYKLFMNNFNFEYIKLYNNLVINYKDTYFCKNLFLNYVITFYFYDSILEEVKFSVYSQDFNNPDISNVINTILNDNKLCFIFLCLIEKFGYTLEEVLEALESYLMGINTWVEDTDNLISTID